MRIPFLGRLLPALVLAALPMAAQAGVFIGVSVGTPPPPLPIYVQPPCPQPGYIWVPGYWAWGPFGYYWVPGTWVLPPEVGLLWTPGYWGWSDGDYFWHDGYWGPQVGFYGGINYGFGYDGDGFDGGYWRGGLFYYNSAVMRVGPGFDGDVYYHHPRYRPDFDRGRFAHVSYNGGRDGILARPNRMDRIAAGERRYGLTSEQRQHVVMARGDRALRADFNHGRPPIAATDHANRFQGHGVFAARAAGGPPMHQGFMRPGQRAMPADRPAWAASPRDAGPRGAVQHNWNRPGARQAWTAPHYAQQPAYHAAPRFQTHPSPQYAYHRAPSYQYHPAPNYPYHPAPRFQQYHPAPNYQYHPAPRFQPYHPAPNYQYHPAPRFQPYHPAPNYQFHPAPRFQARQPAPPRPGPRRPPR